MNDLPIWLGWVIIAAFLTTGTLIAIFYNWVWYDLFQRYEPWSAELGRICAKRPWLWYTVSGLLALFSVISAVMGPWWVRVIFVFVVGFFGWFLPHIAGYAADPDNPPHLVRAFRWANVCNVALSSKSKWY